EDKGADGPARGAPAAELPKDGGGEGAGLACAGLGAPQNVPARQGGGDGFFLNGGGLFIAQFGQRPQDGLVQAEFLKGHTHIPFFISSLCSETDTRGGLTLTVPPGP